MFGLPSMTPCQGSAKLFFFYFYLAQRLTLNFPGPSGRLRGLFPVYLDLRDGIFILIYIFIISIWRAGRGNVVAVAFWTLDLLRFLFLPLDFTF
jgi:hypothetical protein